MELLNIIESNKNNNFYHDIISLYINKYNIKNYVKDVKIKKLSGNILAQYFPADKNIIINSNMDEILLLDNLNINLLKYKVNPELLIRITKAITIIHEMRHAYQNKIYQEEYIDIQNIKFIKNKNISETMYKKIIGDCIYNQTKEIYKENYNYMVIEKDSELESYKELINLLISLDDKSYKNVLNYIINKYKKNIITTGYIKNDLSLSSIQEMYQIYDIEEDYKIIKPYFNNLTLYEKIKYNIDLTEEEIKTLKEINKENIKTFIK